MKENRDLLLMIKANYIQMNPAMKRIADVLLEWMPEKGGYTIGTLADKSNVSNATVTRFAHFMGFENYKSFFRAIQEAYRNKQNVQGASTPTVLFAGGYPNRQDAESACRYVIESEMEMLNDTLSLLDFELMDNVANMFLNARQVLFLGEGHSYLAAQSAQMRFQRLGILCNAYGDYHGMISGVCMSEPADIVVGISNMGCSAPVTECLELARKNGIGTIAITCVKGSPVDQAAEISLLTGFNYGSFSSKNLSTCYEPGSENLPQYSIVDCLYLICIMRRDEKILKRYNQTKKLIEEKRQ